jgi:hypothetical protein
VVDVADPAGRLVVRRDDALELPVVLGRESESLFVGERPQGGRGDRGAQVGVEFGVGEEAFGMRRYV